MGVASLATFMLRAHIPLLEMPASDPPSFVLLFKDLGILAPQVTLVLVSAALSWSNEAISRLQRSLTVYSAPEERWSFVSTWRKHGNVVCGKACARHGRDCPQSCYYKIPFLTLPRDLLLSHFAMVNPARARPLYLPPSAEASGEANEKLIVDSTQLTHTVSFRYPDCSLLDAEPDKQIRVISPEDADERYPYEDLVEDPSVIRNASQLNEGESSFFLLSKVDARHTPFKDNGTMPRMMPMRPGTDGPTRLLHDVGAYQKTVRKTSLRIITFGRGTDDALATIIRVVQKSTCQAGNGDWAENTRSYEFSLDRLGAEQDADPPSQLDLIWRSSRRAVRHVKLWFNESDFFEESSRHIHLATS